MIRSWEELESFLQSLDDLEKKEGIARRDHSFDLAPLQTAVAELKLYPPFTISIVGSKGKSTTAGILGQILRKLSVKAGVYTSPHLFEYTERIAIDGEHSTPAQWLRWSEPLLRFLTDRSLILSRFEFETALALQAFQCEGVRVAVLEAGVGGIRDAIAVAPPQITVLTSVELEHRELLGNTLEEIARQKAGIFSPGSTAIIPENLPPTVKKVVEEIASHRNVELIRISTENFSSDIREKVARKDLQNFAAAVAAAEKFLIHSLHHSPSTISTPSEKIKTLKSLSPLDIDLSFRSIKFYLPGRGGTRVTAVIDPAHTEVSAEVALERFHKMMGTLPRTVVLAPLADKDIKKMIKVFTDAVEEIILVKLNRPRAPSEEQLLSVQREFPKVRVSADLRKTLLSGELEGPVLAVGSNYLPAEISEVFSWKKSDFYPLGKS